MRGGNEDLGSAHPLGAALPGVYADDELLQRFAAGLDSVLGPLANVLDNLPAYFRPTVAPPDFLDWIGGWVGAGSDPLGDPEDVRRRVVAGAVAGHRTRGTRQGLVDAVASIFGVAPEVTESGGATWSARPLAPFPGEPQPSVRVVLRVPDPAAIDSRRLDAVVAGACPAHVPYRIEIRSSEEGSPR